jgi:hypothetical protein
MAVPISQATVSGFHTKELPNNILAPTFTLPLMGDATSAPILEWEWTVAASGENHRGGAPYGSLVASGVKGSFTNGVAKVQNPTAILDTPGGYTFSLRTRNTDGWSDPSYTGDGWRCQTNAYVLTQAGLKLPAPNEYNYEYDIHNSLNTLASGIGGYSITTTPTLSGQVPTWNPTQNEYKPQVPFTNELLGKPLASEHPTMSGQVLTWTGDVWRPATSVSIDSFPFFSVPPMAEVAFTSTAGNYTLGSRFGVFYPSLIRGVSFYTAKAGAHTVRCKLYRSFASSVLQRSVDLPVPGPGRYEAIFSTPYQVVAADVLRQQFIVSMYLTDGSAYTTGGYSFFRQTYTFPTYLLWSRPEQYAAGDACPTSTNTTNIYPVEPIITSFLP